jgi:hypothetical protein
VFLKMIHKNFNAMQQQQQQQRRQDFGQVFGRGQV